MSNRPIILNEQQEAGFDTITQFYLNPMENVLLLKGNSGSGKSTLVRHFLAKLGDLIAMAKLLNPEFNPPEVALTATTQQAAEALFNASGGTLPTRTIHSFLGLRVQRDFKTGTSKLVGKEPWDKPKNMFVVVDEASFADQELLSYMFKRTEKCKFVMIGDHAQLTPVGSNYMPAFKLNNTSIELTKVERQGEGYLKELCEQFRATVLGGPWPKIVPDDDQVYYMDRTKFESSIIKAFQQPEVFGHCKILAYTNARVIYYNDMMSNIILGSSDPQEGQRMIVNTAIVNHQSSCSTGEEVMIAEVRPGVRYDLNGWFIRLRDKRAVFFMPANRKDMQVRIKLYRSEEQFEAARDMEMTCIDLRPSFACTVNKSQGSTFETCFIDLDDICKKVISPNQLARALYVGFSRASKRVVITGDMR